MDCRKRTTHAYRQGSGESVSNPNWVCCGSTTGPDGVIREPHKDGYGHIAGGVEYPDGKVLKWEDGTMTLQGVAVDEKGNPVSVAPVDAPNTFNLPTQPPVHTVVKAGPNSFTRWTEGSVSAQWSQVDKPDNLFSWAQLFVKAEGSPITVTGVNVEEKVKTEIRDILDNQGVTLPSATSRRIIADLKAADVLNHSAGTLAKVGDIYRLGVDTFPDNIEAMIYTDPGATRGWTRDPANGLFRVGDVTTGWANPTLNKDTRTGYDRRATGDMRAHGREYRVTKVKG